MMRLLKARTEITRTAFNYPPMTKEDLLDQKKKYNR